METSLKGAFILDVIDPLALLISYFFRYKMNKPHLGDILWMVFLAEGTYWATVFLGLFACKKLGS